MSYDQNEELERKQKTLKNYWAFAYAQYCMDQQKEQKELSAESYRMFKQVFADKTQPKDKEPERIKKAAVVLKAVEKVHKEVTAIQNVRMNTRKQLEEMRQSKPEDFPGTVRAAIAKTCENFVREKDKTKLAGYGAIILEHLNAMSADPELNAKVGLTDEQMRMAAKVVSIGGIIEEGLKSLDKEMTNGANPKNELTENEHKMNITKIAAMEMVDKERLSGNMLKELQDCDFMKKLTSENRLDLAVKLSNKTERKTMVKNLSTSAKPKQPEKEAPQLVLKPQKG